MNCIKLWWKTRVLKQVVYLKNGKPYDCKGLRYKGELPFGEDTEYYITKEWFSYTYLGCGRYTNYRSFHTDHLNPYWKAAELKCREAFNKKLKVPSNDKYKIL